MAAERVIANTMAMILNRMGYMARAVYSGERAVEIAPEFMPDVLISDVNMGELNGIDAAIRIGQMLPSIRTRLFSGQASTADLLEKAHAQGHDFGIWAAPLYPDHVLDWLSTVCPLQQTRDCLWPAMEVTERKIAGSTVGLARWRADADRQLAFNNDVEFLFVTGYFPAFGGGRFLHIVPYSKACCACCRHIDQALDLTKELRPSLLLLDPHDLVLRRAAQKLDSLLRELPELHVVLYPVERLFPQPRGLDVLLDATRRMPRIELADSPWPPKDFDAFIARHFGLSQTAYR